jgi:hypothetical protein
MNKLVDGHASRPQTRDTHDMNLYLGPCFDLTLSATEVIRIFDDRRKTRLDRHRAATDKPVSELPVAKQSCDKN